MHGKTVVITGATSGIGRVAALRLAAPGARIVAIARDPARGEAIIAELDTSAGQDHRLHLADLSLMRDTRRVATAIAAAEPRIDVLVNNAGALFGRRSETAEGLELTFATNHMSYFLLTEALRQTLIASAPARIVNTASAAHRRVSLVIDDLQSRRRYRGFTVYSRSKLCNILFTRELSRQLAASGVTANCLHPGFVATGFGEASGGALQHIVRAAKAVLAITPEKGAETLVHLAASPEIAHVSGEYFDDGRPALTSPEARNDALAARLWHETARLAGLKPT
jgi:NAD(P)-dependent dehydrogenase (short-subunit alcohol dehydrogenase family)